MKKTYEQRLAEGAFGGGVGGLTMGGPVGGVIGGLGGAAASALGYGMSDDPVGGGALTGGALGGGAGLVGAGMNPGGSALLRKLMAGGLSKKKALALLLGVPTATGAAVGGAAGAAVGGIEKILGFE